MQHHRRVMNRVRTVMKIQVNLMSVYQKRKKPDLKKKSSHVSRFLRSFCSSTGMEFHSLGSLTTRSKECEVSQLVGLINLPTLRTWSCIWSIPVSWLGFSSPRSKNLVLRSNNPLIWIKDSTLTSTSLKNYHSWLSSISISTRFYRKSISINRKTNFRMRT